MIQLDGLDSGCIELSGNFQNRSYYLDSTQNPRSQVEMQVASDDLKSQLPTCRPCARKPTRWPHSLGERYILSPRAPEPFGPKGTKSAVVESNGD